MRTQRCSISAEIGYSAWSMKLRWRFSAISRCASGSIHVVTNVARLRCGSPSIARSTSTSLMASVALMPSSGNVSEGAGTVRKRLPKSPASSHLVMRGVKQRLRAPPRGHAEVARRNPARSPKDAAYTQTRRRTTCSELEPPPSEPPGAALADVLPTERDLVEQYGISSSTASKVIALLNRVAGRALAAAPTLRLVSSIPISPSPHDAGAQQSVRVASGLIDIDHGESVKFPSLARP